MRPTGLRRRLQRLFFHASLLLLGSLSLLAIAGRQRIFAAILVEHQQLAKACARSVDATLSGLFQRLRRLPEAADESGELNLATLRSLRLQSPFQRAIFLTDGVGKPLIADPARAVPALTERLPQREAVTGILDQRGGPVVAIVQPFRSADRERHLVLEMALRQSALSRSLLDLITGSRVQLALVDVSGRVLAASAEEALLRRLPEELQMGENIAQHRPVTLARARCAICPSQSTSADHVLVLHPLQYAPWGLVMQVSRSEVLYGLRSLLPLSIVIGLLPLAIGTILARAVSRSVVRPLQELSSQAERLRGGDTAHSIHTEGDQEIQSLAATLEEARVRLLATMGELEAANEGLEQQVAARTEESKRLVRRLLNAGEEERRRIARELHDEVAQLLTAVQLSLAPIGDQPSAQRARELIQRTQREIHRVIHDLRPSLLDDLGLAAAMRRSVERGLAAAGVAVSLELDEELRPPPEIEIALFRIFQEATTNILRHASAENVSVELTSSGASLTLAVEDDGVGFSPSGSADGVGLLGMRERAELIGARFTIDSEPGAGTSIVLEVPLPP